MTRVLLLGPQGMLGTAIRECASDDIEVMPAVLRFHSDAQKDFQIAKSLNMGTYDAVINTIGALPDRDWHPGFMAYLNGVLPHLLASKGHFIGIAQPKAVIHVSTDCVYGPSAGYYPKLDYVQRVSGSMSPDPDTHYGRTKLAGESENAINVRTSFVGVRHGLWKWAWTQAMHSYHPVLDGWRQAWWSGSTVMAVAHALIDLARDPGEPRTLHLATETPISKFELLETLKRQHNWPVEINPVDEPRIDRSLHPDITLPPFADALREMVS